MALFPTLTRSTRRFNAPDGPLTEGRAEVMASQLADEMSRAWREGDGPTAEEFFARYPQLCAFPSVAVRLVYEEVCLRQDAGQEVDTRQVLGRFPQWQRELEVLLHCHDVMQGAAGPTFPEPGERLGEFCLLNELGRGALGRVFLAKQPALSDRAVVLKLTPCTGGEHLSLARLQHTSIVPLLLSQEFPARNLRALCMPYVGGISLARCWETITTPYAARTGQDLVAALKGAEASQLEFNGPALQFFSRVSYAQAIAWIGACLADGLQYAHERKLMHLDLKPSNVLLAGDGQPMLLDFHLAREFISAGGARVDSLGGTPGYMSPEQQSALASLRRGQPITAAVDGRSDIYSLGLVLYEALGGTIPAQPTSPRLSRINPQVSRGLEDVIQKCLAQLPKDRYQSAAALAGDLRRHLADLPLSGVPNRSLLERWRKWRRRAPHRLSVAVILLGTPIAAIAYTADRVQTASTALESGKEQLEGKSYSLATESFQRGIETVRWIPGQSDLKKDLQTSLVQAKRSSLAQKLHAIVERLRFLYGVESLPAGRLQELEAACKTLWEARHEIAKPNGTPLPAELDRGIETDLLDLAILWADLRVRLAPQDPSGARRQALQVLEEAEAAFGKSAVLEQERQVYAADLGGVSASAPPYSGLQAKTAWEHYALGRSLFRRGDLRRAVAEFERAIELKPQFLWPNFYYATCSHRLGHYQEAVAAWKVCVALSPDSPECYYNRGLAHAALGQKKQAQRDYERAAALDPSLVPPAEPTPPPKPDPEADDARPPLPNASSRFAAHGF